MVLLLVSLVASAGAQTGARSQSAVLITNARIFDGKNEKLIAGMSVLVEGNRISKIAPSIPALSGAEVIEAAGHVLMPGGHR